VAAFVLPFEKPIVDLVEKVRALRELAARDPRFEPELARLEEKASQLAREIFTHLSPMQKVQVSRHANRPYTLDYVRRLFTDWVELKGDRRFADDGAIVSGLATFRGRSVVVVGHQKGRGTKENMKRNFGMPHPEGYRKAIRMYEMAERFQLPILTFIDTPGAYPGLGAEERGQSEAIGAALAAMARATVPIIATIIGEGGSGGALALGVANRVLVLEYGCYSVISPEGCAAILWKDGSRAEEAAEQRHPTLDQQAPKGLPPVVVVVVAPHGVGPVPRAERREQAGDVAVESRAARQVVAGRHHEVGIGAVRRRHEPRRGSGGEQGADVEIAELCDAIPVERRVEPLDADVDRAHARQARADEHRVRADEQGGAISGQGDLPELGDPGEEERHARHQQHRGQQAGAPMRVVEALERPANDAERADRRAAASAEGRAARSTAPPSAGRR
jgi:acetyl-CoA carboxylase carboxyl transferase subunit alpha